MPTPHLTHIEPGMTLTYLYEGSPHLVRGQDYVVIDDGEGLCVVASGFYYFLTELADEDGAMPCFAVKAEAA